MTQIDGGTLASSSALLQTTPVALAVDQTTNRIFTVGGESGSYRGQYRPPTGARWLRHSRISVNEPAAGSQYHDRRTLFDVPCFYDLLGSIDGNDLSMFNMTVGGGPVDVAVDETNNRTYVINECGDTDSAWELQGTVSVIDETPPTAWQLRSSHAVPGGRRRCDEGPFGGPAIPGGSIRSFAIPQGSCGSAKHCGLRPERHRCAARRIALPDHLAYRTAATNGVDHELDGWTHQGQRCRRRRGNQRGHRLCQRHHRRHSRHQRLLVPLPSQNALAAASPDAMPRGGHARR